MFDQSQDELGPLAQSFAELGADLADQKDPDTALAVITARAVKVVPGAEEAGVTRSRVGGFDTVAATGELPIEVDQIQYDLGSGPCVDAVVHQRVYSTGDVARDPRWPEFGRRAAEQTGLQSMLSFRMFLEDDERIAGLNFYARQPDAFDARAERTALLLATHGVAVMAINQRQNKIDNLERALATSREIGTAIGILMALLKVTREQAFDLLRVASQHRHRRLADIARDVVETGTLDIGP
jgi:hypothetical protein